MPLLVRCCAFLQEPTSESKDPARVARLLQAGFEVGHQQADDVASLARLCGEWIDEHIGRAVSGGVPIGRGQEPG
ncbi:hypothetical protein [Actinacidiphila oryziradicis]|uniref:hypothetical protein n=1 Tax=Actinacidiphila oryziradicis TaxID=2571141 RepID=UPI001FE7433A|nr:hypothetical protein [Actinacidiphila oryziradicis]